MLYTIFIYQSESGLLMYDKSFQDISSGKMELFSSFFSALKTFISEMVLKGSKELKNIEMGDYTILITSIQEIKADLVVIADKEDHKDVNKLVPKILKVLMKHEEVFTNWQGDRDALTVLEEPLNQIIAKKKKLIGDSNILERPEDFLASMWEHKTEIDLDVKNKLLVEKESLTQNLAQIINVQGKLAITERLLQIAEQTKNGKEFLKYQQDVKQFKDQIKDIKIKMKYYIDKVKTSLSSVLDKVGNKSLKDIDYKDVYLNLYSFSSKLKLLDTTNRWEEYKEYANILINKQDHSAHEMSETVSRILNISEDVDEILR